MPTLDRDVAEAIYKLVGEYETEWILDSAPCDVPACNCPDTHSMKVRLDDVFPHPGFIPLPSFSETIRIIPRIAEKLEWSENGLWGTADDLARDYMLAPSPEQGMKEVSNYLRKIL